MPRGQPDYGITTSTPVASGISDPGEAAARLGSINVYDRRGWTVWMDDFEAPLLRWISFSSAGGTDPILSTVHAWHGVQGLRFYTAAVVGEWATILRRFPLIRLGKVGVEFSILLQAISPGYFEVRMQVYDGTNRSHAELRLDNQARTATIVTPAGNIVVATFCFNEAAQNAWVPVKLVIDMDDDTYTRLLIGPQEIDLSAHSLVDGGLSDNRMLWVDATLRSIGGDIMSAWLDNFIMTQNES